MSPKSKQAPKDTGAKGFINRAYVYGERHVATVAFVALGLGVVLSAAAIFGFFNERAIERRVTHTETACTLHPAGKKCQTTKQRSDEKRSVASACVLAYKLDKNGQLLRLTKCPVEPHRQKAVEAAAERHPAEGPTASAQLPAPKGGDAESSPEPVGSSQPGPRHGGGGGSTEVDGGGHGVKESPENLPPPTSGESPAAAPAPTATSSPGTSSSSTTERTSETTVVERSPAPEAEAAVRSTAGALVESVGSTVEGLGETVGGTVEGVESTTCSLAKLLC